MLPQQNIVPVHLSVLSCTAPLSTDRPAYSPGIAVSPTYSNSKGRPVHELCQDTLSVDLSPPHTGRSAYLTVTRFLKGLIEVFPHIRTDSPIGLKPSACSPGGTTLRAHVHFFSATPINENDIFASNNLTRSVGEIRMLMADSVYTVFHPHKYQ